MITISPVSDVLSLYETPTGPLPESTRVEPEQSAGETTRDTAQFSLEAQRRAGSPRGKNDTALTLTPEQQVEVEKMKQRDQEVRTHEQAHVMAGGNLVRGGASYTFRTGPDGKRYATDGEVNIDAAPVDGDPRATIRKMQQVRKAAMAPAQPSGQDQAVAASATKTEMNAVSELSRQNGVVTKKPAVNRFI